MNRHQARKLGTVFTWELEARRLLGFFGKQLSMMGQPKEFVRNSRYVEDMLALPVKGVEGEAS